MIPVAFRLPSSCLWPENYRNDALNPLYMRVFQTYFCTDLVCLTAWLNWKSAHHLVAIVGLEGRQFQNQDPDLEILICAHPAPVCVEKRYALCHLLHGGAFIHIAQERISGSARGLRDRRLIALPIINLISSRDFRSLDKQRLVDGTEAENDQILSQDYRWVEGT